MAASPFTQRDRILRALQAAGTQGVRSTDFLRPDDGLAPILRVASRIAELRDRGYPIATRRAENGTAEYWLTALVLPPADHQPPAPAPADDAPPSGRLFDLETSS